MQSHPTEPLGRVNILNTILQRGWPQNTSKRTIAVSGADKFIQGQYLTGECHLDLIFIVRTVVCRYNWPYSMEAI